jgi:hypothetical protein
LNIPVQTALKKPKEMCKPLRPLECSHFAVARFLFSIMQQSVLLHFHAELSSQFGGIAGFKIWVDHSRVMDFVADGLGGTLP